MTGLAAVLAAVAVWLGGHRPSRRLRALESSAMREPGPAARRVGVLMGRLAIVVVTTAAAGLVLGAAAVAGTLALAVMAVAGARLRHRATARAESAALRGRVIEACAVLATDLRAGRPAADALDAAAGVCAELAPAVVAARLGGDVAATLHQGADRPGGAGLRALAAAWRVADRSGAALAGVAERVADALRADEVVQRQVAAGLASARATARVMAGLPVLGLALGHAVGARPVAFLTGGPPGWLCLALGLALAIGGLTWVERLADGCEPAGMS